MKNKCKRCGGVVTLDYDPDECHRCNGQDEQWASWCAEVDAAEQTRNANRARAAFAKNPNATSADILGEPDTA